MEGTRTKAYIPTCILGVFQCKPFKFPGSAGASGAVVVSAYGTPIASPPWQGKGALKLRLGLIQAIADGVHRKRVEDLSFRRPSAPFPPVAS